MDRRGFLSAMLAAATAPVYVKASSLMPIVVPKTELILPKHYYAISIKDGVPFTDYTFSAWTKHAGTNGEWEFIKKTVTTDENGVAEDNLECFGRTAWVKSAQVEKRTNIVLTNRGSTFQTGFGVPPHARKLKWGDLKSVTMEEVQKIWNIR